MAASLVYVVCAGPAEAESIGTALVERRLAACVNILGGARSIYLWRGEVERAEETVLIAKTRRELVEPLTKAVKELHGYEIPCVVALDIVGGDPDFLEWIRRETRSGE